MKDTLVFGASLKPDRYSNLAIERLVGKEIAVHAYGIKAGVLHGVQVKTNLIDFQNIHTITLYLNEKRQKEYYNDIINLRPKRVIFNPGTENLEFQGLLEKNGIEVVTACTLVLLAIDAY